jgi:hypothetical protein
MKNKTLWLSAPFMIAAAIHAVIRLLCLSRGSEEETHV